MTSETFLQQLQDYYDREYEAIQLESIKHWLERFAGPQLDALLVRAEKLNKYLPKIFELNAAAEELGFAWEQKLGRAHPEHVWTPTDCRLCHGQGRLSIFKEVFKVQVDGGLQMRRRQTRILPLEGVDTMDYRYKHPTEEEYWCRCSCPAGDTPVLVTLGWPRYMRATEQAAGGVGK